MASMTFPHGVKSNYELPTHSVRLLELATDSSHWRLSVVLSAQYYKLRKGTATQHPNQRVALIFATVTGSANTITPSTTISTHPGSRSATIDPSANTATGMNARQ